MEKDRSYLYFLFKGQCQEAFDLRFFLESSIFREAVHYAAFGTHGFRPMG